MNKRKLNIRGASRDDARVIESITSAAYSKWVARIGRKPLPMTVDYSSAVSKHRFDLLEWDGQVVGLIETIPADQYLLIENVAVSPDYQRKGFGRILLNHAERVAERSGFSELRLYTNELFEGNITLYESCGFIAYQRTPIEGGVKVDMLKTL